MRVAETLAILALANGYPPEIAAIARDYREAGVDFLLMHVDPELGNAE